MPGTASDRLYGLTTSVAVKAPVRAVSTVNLTLSGLQTVGGVALAADDRVLVKAQTDATENGIYIASTSDWQRAADFDGLLDVVQGTLVVDQSNTGLYYRVTSANPIRPGTDEIEFELVTTSLTPNGVGQALWPRTAAEIAVSVTPTYYHYESGDIRRYGASAAASGATNTAALQTACNVIKQQGYGVIAFGPERYDLGTYGAGSQQIVSVTDLKNAIFDFRGGELYLTVTHNDADVAMLTLNDPINIRFNKPRFVASGASAPFSQLGPKAVSLTVSGTSGPEIGDVTFEQPYFEGLTSTLRVYRSGGAAATRRLRRIRLRGGFVKNCYYGPNFQQTGDDFEGDWTCLNVRRCYFPYGVRRHRASIEVTNDTANFTADSCCNIATQPEADTSAAPIPTQDIHVDVTFRGDVSPWSSLVTFYHVGASTPQTFKDCSAFLNLSGVSNLTSTKPFLFKSHVSSGGAEETTTTQNVWKDIRIDALCNESNRGTAADGLLHLNVSPSSGSSIFLGSGLRFILGQLDTSNQSNMKLDNWRLYYSNNAFAQFKTGDLTSGNVAIDLTHLDTLPFTFKLRIWAKSQRNLSGQDVTYTERMVTGYNAGGGGVAISAEDVLLTHSTGTPAGITVGVSGETLTVTFTGYSNSEAKAYVAVEHEWPFVALPSVA